MHPRTKTRRTHDRKWGQLRSSAKTASDKAAIERQIAATDRQIDALVYELYGLTREKVRIVEGTEK